MMLRHHYNDLSIEGFEGHYGVCMRRAHDCVQLIFSEFYSFYFAVQNTNHCIYFQREVLHMRALLQLAPKNY